MNVAMDEESFRAEEKMLMHMLNRLPINESAARIVEERFPDPMLDDGLHLIRLLACVADEEGVDCQSVLADLCEMSEMCARDALAFMYYLDREYGYDSADFAVDEGLRDCMASIYYCLPGHIRERMVGMGECNAYCEKYADTCDADDSNA